MILRHYGQQDVEEIVKLIKQELPKLPNYKGIEVDEARVRFLLQNNETNATFFCVVLCDSHTIVGGIAAYCAPTLFSFATVAQDTFLYIKPDYRSLSNVRMLIKAYVDWASARGASLISASHTSGFKPDAMRALMLREGFEEVGKLYHLRKDMK